MSVGTLLSALVAIGAVDVGVVVAKQVDYVTAFIILGFVAVFILLRIRSLTKRFQTRIGQLDTLLENVYLGKPNPRLTELLREKY